MTPYEKFKSLPNAAQYLNKGWSLKKLDRLAGELSDFEAAKRMNEAKDKLFRTFGKTTQAA